MGFDSMNYFKVEVAERNEQDANLHAQIDFELGLLPEDLRTHWENVFDNDPELYPLPVQLDTIRRIRDIREGRVHFQKKEQVAVAEVHPSEASREHIQKAFTEAISAFTSRELFLGNGATAEVFGLPEAPNVCVKVITDHRAYQNGSNNTLHHEVRFLQRVQDLEVRGVRAPKFYFHIENMTVLAYCMERLEAVNMSHILTGLVPSHSLKELDADVFCNALHDYVLEMHARGIVHNDLAPRNIMIDKDTSLPFIIDFGRAKDLALFNGVEQDEFIKRDIMAVEALRDFIKGFQSGVRYKFGG